MASQSMIVKHRTVQSRRATFSTEAAWYVGMSVLAFCFLFPFLWTVMSSLKHPSELVSFPPTMFPKVPQWGNYARVFEKVPFMTWVYNTLFVVAMNTLGMLLSASLSGYSFARFEFKGKNLIFLATLGTMMLPAQITLIPQFVLFHKLHWINTFRPLWIPAWFGGGAFAIFLFRQFIMGLPRELDESAVIDGAGPLRIWVSILAPLCKPVSATLAVISVIGAWNDFLGPVIYLNTATKFTLAVGLNYFRKVEEVETTMEHLLMAASVMTTVPLIILFFTTQRYFVQGVALTGIKG